MSKNNLKKKYTILLSIVFLGIAGYRLLQKFIWNEEIATYQWMLAIGLAILGIYQLIGVFRNKTS